MFGVSENDLRNMGSFSRRENIFLKNIFESIVVVPQGAGTNDAGLTVLVRGSCLLRSFSSPHVVVNPISPSEAVKNPLRPVLDPSPDVLLHSL